jgi:SAM-dependent methyltransferase
MDAQPRTDASLDTGTLWNLTQEAIQGGRVFEGMEHLLQQLGQLRASCPGTDWTTVTGDFLAHPVRDLIHRGPLTRSAFAKTRGYAGDATTLDLIYGINRVDSFESFEESLFRWEYQTHSCRGVRARRDRLAEAIDRAAETQPAPRILSVACGHLREAALSGALSRKQVGEFVALDQDPRSLEQVERDYGALGVHPFEGSVRGLLGDRYDLGQFDLIYSAGLYDYLAPPTARRLTATLFRRLTPGGRLLLANFAPSLPDIGYMEACMDWCLIYRDEADIASLTSEIPQDLLQHQRTYRDAVGHIVYLELGRG